MMEENKEMVMATVETSSGILKEAEIQQEVSIVETQAKALSITTDEEYGQAAEFGKQIKTQAKTVMDFFKPMKDSAHQAHKTICDREKKMLQPLQEAEKEIKRNIADYLRKKEKERLELEAKMRKAAEEERERQLEEAAKLEEAGKTEEAEVVLMEAQVTETVAVNSKVYMDTPKTKSVSSTKDWEIQNIDAEKVPINFGGMEIRPVDDKAILRLIRASKGTIQIPGINYKETIKIGIRR